jgi:hypothetical protein
MLPGALSRLPSAFPLRRALALAHPGDPLGAWVRVSRWPLHLRAGGRALLVGHDLGYLLRRCTHILLSRCGPPAVLGAQQLIAWRTLQIAVASPCLPPLEALRAIYPRLHVTQGRIVLPLGLDGAEPALAFCAAERIPVSATWIDYQDAGSG